MLTGWRQPSMSGTILTDKRIRDMYSLESIIVFYYYYLIEQFLIFNEIKYLT